jgi:hypothetical protein
MEKSIAELKVRYNYLKEDLKNNYHDEQSKIYIRGQIAGIKETMKILGIIED